MLFYICHYPKALAWQSHVAARECDSISRLKAPRSLGQGVRAVTCEARGPGSNLLLKCLEQAENLANLKIFVSAT